MKNVEIKANAMDEIYRSYREEILETYAQSGTVDIPALAIIPDGRKGHDPFVAFPLYDIYVSIDQNEKINVNEEQLRAANAYAKQIGSKVTMFIVAIAAKTESQFGVKDTLLLAAKQEDGLTIINLWLKDLEGVDGILTESVGHAYEKWSSEPGQESLETAIGLKYIDALWREYILISKVETMFDDKEETKVGAKRTAKKAKD